MKTEHILVIRFSAMGDVAMVVPVVSALARQYPHVRITVLSRPFARPLFENLASNVGFMEADLQNEYHGIKGLNALYRRLIAKNFTAIADLHNVLRSEYLRMRFNLANFHVAHINKHRAERRHLTQYNGKILQPLPSVFESYAHVFEELGYPIDLSEKGKFLTDNATVEVKDTATTEERTCPVDKYYFPLLHLRQLPTVIGEKRPFQQWIGIAPFAAHRGKAYPISLMEQVIAQLQQRHPSARFFLFGGGQQEIQQLHDLQQRHPKCVCVPEILNGLLEELSLMSQLDVMISMDSANMHLASLVHTPVVSVWGATHPYAGFMGWQQNPNLAVQIDLSCRPCSIFGNKHCLRKDYACLRNISPELIINKVEQVLK